MTYISIEKTCHTGSTITLGDGVDGGKVVEKTLGQIAWEAGHPARHDPKFDHISPKRREKYENIARAVTDHLAKGRRVDGKELQKLVHIYWAERSLTVARGLRAVLREVGVEVGE